MYEVVFKIILQKIYFYYTYFDIFVLDLLKARDLNLTFKAKHVDIIEVYLLKYYFESHLIYK